MALGEGKNKGQQEEAPAFKAAAAQEPDDSLDSVRNELNKQKRIKIMIPSTETKKTDVAVSVNGYAFLIQRDKTVEVPEAVVEVLKNAIITTYRQENRKDGEGVELIPVHSLRDAFQILQ